MLVTLAYPFEGHAPDDTVDLPDDVAERLIRDGYARTPDVTSAPQSDAGESGATDKEKR